MKTHMLAVTVVLLTPFFPRPAAAQESSTTPRLVLTMPVSFSDENRTTPGGVRRITLKDAQQLATAAGNPLAQLAEYQVEAARQHRLGVKSLYFPNVGTQFEALHFDKVPGEVLTVSRPIVGTTLGVPVNIIEQDQFAVNVSVTQPITQVFAVHQLVKIARADENIVRAKTTASVAQTARAVQKTYFELLAASLETASLGAEAKRVRADTFSADKAMVLATVRVKELTASLNELLGLPLDTRLELQTPEPLVENVTLRDAIAQSEGNVEVIAAQQTANKAHAATTLARMQYAPGIAAIGGYTHQEALNVVLPQDFAYVGVMATYTLFDSLKRERGVKEAAAQAHAADLGVQLEKEKAAAAVKRAYFELERAREIYRLARTRALPSAAARVVAVSHGDGSDGGAATAKSEAEMLRAELEYREAYADLKALIGTALPGGS